MSSFAIPHARPRLSISRHSSKLLKQRSTTLRCRQRRVFSIQNSKVFHMGRFIPATTLLSIPSWAFGFFVLLIRNKEQPTEQAYLSLSPCPSWRSRQQRLEAAPHVAPRVRDGKCRVLNSLSTWVQAAWQRMTPLRANRCFTSNDAIKIISHRQAQRQLSQGILNSVKLTSDTNIIACMHVLFPLPPPTSVKASLSLFLWM